MISEKGYRFNIQFTARTEEAVRVGEFLNSLGRRKSAVIIAALNEYLDNHPELHGDVKRYEVSTLTVGQLEEQIHSIIDKKLSGLVIPQPNGICQDEATPTANQDIVDMLDDLELFTM